MKRLNLILIVIILILTFILWSGKLEYTSLENNVQLLKDRNFKLEEENDSLSIELINIDLKLIKIDSQKVESDKENNKLRLSVERKNKELKNITGRYKELSNDSLVLSLKKAYEMDSILHINK